MGFYDNIDKADPANGGGDLARAGHYLGLVERVRSGISKKSNSDYVAVDFKILHTYEDSAEPLVQVKPGESFTPDPKGLHKPGQSITVMFMSKHASAQGNYRSCIGNILGAPAESIDPSTCAEIESTNALAGLVVEINNRVVETKAGGPFTKCWFTREVPASEFSQVLSEEIAAQFFPDGFDELIKAESA